MDFKATTKLMILHTAGAPLSTSGMRRTRKRGFDSPSLRRGLPSVRTAATHTMLHCLLDTSEIAFLVDRSSAALVEWIKSSGHPEGRLIDVGGGSGHVALELAKV